MDYVKLIGAGVLGGLVAGMVMLYFLPKQQEVKPGASPAQSTFSSQRVLAITMSLANGTTTSVLNNSGNDEYLTNFAYGCSGLGTSLTAYAGAALANLTVKAATTSTSLSGNTAASNTSANTNLSITTTNIATTSSAFTVVASTTIADPTASFMIVPANSYLTFITNATNTGVCTFSSQVLGS